VLEHAEINGNNQISLRVEMGSSPSVGHNKFGVIPPLIPRKSNKGESTRNIATAAAVLAPQNGNQRCYVCRIRVDGSEDPPYVSSCWVFPSTQPDSVKFEGDKVFQLSQESKNRSGD
jgi:hypothetical protein